MNEETKRFFEWLQSLKPFELLDLLMNCGYLLGKTVKPEEVENGTENGNEETSDVLQSVEPTENDTE